MTDGSESSGWRFSNKFMTFILFLVLAFACSFLVFANETAVSDSQTCSASDGTCSASSSSCLDDHPRCSDWALEQECTKNRDYMHKHCPKSCNVCADMQEVDETAWGVEQEVSGDKTGEIKQILQTTYNYMVEQVFIETKYEEVRENCQNRHKLCAFWAAIGECEVNPKYMALHCAPSCQSCELLSFETRCPYDRNAPTALQKEGDLNAVFERIVTLPHYRQYQPKVHSKPKNDTDMDDDVIDGPWVISLENFLSTQECLELVELGAKEGYERSSDVGEAKFDGTFDSYENDGRTSTNAWCVDDCYKNATITAVLRRMENLTGIPEANYEYLQMLQYQVGQYYQTHHDYIEHHLDRSEGPRVLTLFLYLNDVEEGGGTNFPTLGEHKDGLTIMPKCGKALLWPSVLDKDPNAKDGRTTHQALPVLKGIKYGANAWIHQRDFKEPYNRSCH